MLPACELKSTLDYEFSFVALDNRSVFLIVLHAIQVLGFEDSSSLTDLNRISCRTEGDDAVSTMLHSGPVLTCLLHDQNIKFGSTVSLSPGVNCRILFYPR